MEPQARVVITAFGFPVLNGLISGNSTESTEIPESLVARGNLTYEGEYDIVSQRLQAFQVSQGFITTQDSYPHQPNTPTAHCPLRTPRPHPPPCLPPHPPSHPAARNVCFCGRALNPDLVAAAVLP